MKLAVFCTVSTGIDAISYAVNKGLKIDLIVGVSPLAKVNAISGYLDISEFCKSKGIAYMFVDSYSLTSALDKDNLLRHDIEYIWVAGWQRLLPEWLINHVSGCVLGGHGSPDGITSGRGRSPQNWALITGAQKFYISLFVIEEGIDNGKILDEKCFSYNEYDDILTSYFKASLCMAEMVLNFFFSPNSCLANAVTQSDIPSYYPQRLESDGWADWCLSQTELARVCRALTKPYPGMRTMIESDLIDIRIWKCFPFDDFIGGSIGEINHVFFEGCFLVGCRDGRLLVTEWSASNTDWKPEVGNILFGKNLSDEIQEIVRRHQQRFPDLPVSKRILRYQRLDS